MKRTAIALILPALAAALPICGCEGQPRTTNAKQDQLPIATRNSKEDQKLIAQFIGNWRTEQTGNDLDAIMRSTSESFGLAGGFGSSKEGFRKALASFLADGGEVRLSKAVLIKLEGNQALIGPCYLGGRSGPLRLVFEKEGARWLLTAMVSLEEQLPRNVRSHDGPFHPEKTSKDEERVAQSIEDFKATLAGGKPEKIAQGVSENFVFPEGGKAEFLAQFASLKAEIVLGAATIDIENGKASVGPLKIAIPGQDIDVTFVLQKEGDEWMLIALFPGQLDDIPEVGDLPDVTFPEGAFEPVEESQY